MCDPVDPAKRYRHEGQIVRAESSSSMLLIILGLRHAGQIRAGQFLAAASYSFGCVNVVAVWLAAVAKLLWRRSGPLCWQGDRKSAALVTRGKVPPGALEMTGWRLVPAAISATWILWDRVERAADWWLCRYRLTVFRKQGLVNALSTPPLEWFRGVPHATTREDNSPISRIVLENVFQRLSDKWRLSEHPDLLLMLWLKR